MSFMSGIPRIKPNIGRIKKDSFFKGAAERYLQNRDNEKKDALERKKLELDEFGLQNQKLAYENQAKQLENASISSQIKKEFNKSQIDLAKGITELDRFVYKNEAGQDEKFTYVNPTVGRVGEDAKMNPSDHRKIVLSIEDFLDPEKNSPTLLKNKINAVKESKVFKDFMLENIQKMSKATSEVDVNTQLPSTIYHGAIVDPVNNFSSENDFKNLISTFDMLDTRNMSLKDYFIQLQEQAFTDAGIDIRSQDYNDIKFIVNDEGRSVIYNDFSIQDQIPAGTEGVAKRMFAKSAEEEDFKKRILIFRTRGNLNLAEDVLKISSVISSEKAKDYINLSKISEFSGPDSKEMQNIAKFVQTLATDLSDPKATLNTGPIRNVDQTRKVMHSFVNSYVVQNATKFGTIIEKGGKLYLKTNVKYEKQKVALSKKVKGSNDATQTTLGKYLDNIIGISTDGYKDIDRLFKADKNIETYLQEALKADKITEEEADKFREYKLGEAVTGGLFENFQKAKNAIVGLIDVGKGTVLGNKQYEGDRREIDSFQGNDELTARSSTVLNRASKAYHDRMSNARELFSNGTISEKIFNERAKAEGIKVRLAFKLASIVQGGGTGGRTISNQDYEVIVRSLYGFGTNVSFTEALGYVRHVLVRAAEVNKVYRDYAHTGLQNELMDVAGNYLDTDYAIRTDAEFTIYSPDKSADQVLREMATSADAKNTQVFMQNIIGSDPAKLVNLVGAFGNANDSNNFIGLGTNSQKILVDSIPSKDLTSKRKIQKAAVFKSLSTSIILPHIIIDRKNQNIPVNDDMMINGLTSIFNNPKFAESMVNDFKTMAGVNNLKDLGDVSSVRDIMISNLTGIRDNETNPVSEKNKALITGVIDEVQASGSTGGSTATTTGGSTATTTGGSTATATTDFMIKPAQIISKAAGLGGTKLDLELNDAQITKGKEIFAQKMKEFEQYATEDKLGRASLSAPLSGEKRIVNGVPTTFGEFASNSFIEVFGEDLKTDRYYAQFLNQIGQRGLSSTLFGSIF